MSADIVVELPSADTLNFEDIPHDEDAMFSDEKFQDSRTLLGNNKSDSSSSDPSPNASVWSMDYYRQFFNVSTADIRTRLLRSLAPKGNFYARNEVPDLYGPFWIATSLVVMLAATGNFASYIHFLPSDTTVEWKYDFEKVTIAASVFYIMISLVPLAVYFAMRKIGVSGDEPWISHIISIYGYSFFSYIPAAVICVAPFDLVRWLTILVCFLLSAWFVVRNVRSYFPVDELHWDAKAQFQGTVLLGVLVLVHLAVALVTKLYFFHYAALPDLPVVDPPTAAFLPAPTPAVDAAAAAAAAVASTAGVVADKIAETVKDAIASTGGAPGGAK